MPVHPCLSIVPLCLLAASMGYKPVAVTAGSNVNSSSEKKAVGGTGPGVMLEKSGLLSTLSSIPKDGLIGNGGRDRPAAPERSRVSIASSDSDSEGNPRATPVHKHEDAPVHPANTTARVAGGATRDSPIEEEVMDEYEDDWDEEDIAPSPKPEAPVSASVPPTATTGRSPAATSSKPLAAPSGPGTLLGGSAIADLMSAAEANVLAVAGARGGGGERSVHSAAPTAAAAARGLDFGTSKPSSQQAPGAVDGEAKIPSRKIVSGEADVLRGDAPEEIAPAIREALQDQSYATDSETEELEKKRFFEKVEQHGKPDYAALSARSATTSPSQPSAATAPRPASSGSPVHASMLKGVESKGEGADDALGRVAASAGSGILAGIGAEDSSLIKASGAWSDSVTDSPAKRAVRDSTMASADVAALLAGNLSCCPNPHCTHARTHSAHNTLTRTCVCACMPLTNHIASGICTLAQRAQRCDDHRRPEHSSQILTYGGRCRS